MTDEVKWLDAPPAWIKNERPKEYVFTDGSRYLFAIQAQNHTDNSINWEIYLVRVSCDSEDYFQFIDCETDEIFDVWDFEDIEYYMELS